MRTVVCTAAPEHHKVPRDKRVRGLTLQTSNIPGYTLQGYLIARHLSLHSICIHFSLAISASDASGSSRSAPTVWTDMLAGWRLGTNAIYRLRTSFFQHYTITVTVIIIIIIIIDTSFQALFSNPHLSSLRCTNKSWQKPHFVSTNKTLRILIDRENVT